MGKTKRGIGYELYVYHDHTYAHLTVKVLLGTIEDAAKQYDECPTKEGLEKLEAVRAAGNSCKFLYANYKSSICFQWQADREGWDRDDNDYRKSRWYGGKISECEMGTDCVALLAKIVKQMAVDKTNAYDSPESVIATLEKLGAKPVRNPRELYLSYYVFLDAYDGTKITGRPWGELPSKLEVVEVA